MRWMVKQAALKQTLFMRIGAALMLAVTLAIAAPAPAQAADPVYTGWFSNVAVGGYDPVAYFTKGEPVKGKSEFSMRYKGAEWRFSSKENLDRFKAEPQRYAPQYGGYCAWAMASGDTQSGDPQYWTIVDGKLYLNYDAEIQKRWEKDIPGFIERADREWPMVVKD